MKKIAQTTRTWMYVAIFGIFVLAAAKAHAFWCPDLVPHPECPMSDQLEDKARDMYENEAESVLGDPGEGSWA